MNAALKELMARIEAWPDYAQAEAVRVLEEIDRELSEPDDLPLTADDRAAIEQGLADVRAGRLHSLDDVRALFDPYRGK